MGLAHAEVQIYSTHVVQEALCFIKHIKKIHFILIGRHKYTKELEFQEFKIIRLKILN